MIKKIRYSDGIYKNLYSNLYSFENIKFYESLDTILDAFEENYKKRIEQKLNNIGLKLIKFVYYTPNMYNYEGDSIDTIVEIIDIEKLRNAIKSNSDIINAELLKNQSHDGYIALTVDNVDAEIENTYDSNYEIDVIVLRELLNIDMSEFHISDYVVWDDSDDED